MQTIKEHIKKNEFTHCYLLYGTENYLKKLYKNKLKDAIVGREETMNFSNFEGKSADPQEVIQIAETLPFFSERRLILIENSGWFKSQTDLADYMKHVPETTYFVFVESEVDKRNRLYKAVKDMGTISEMNGMDEHNLELWIVSLLRNSGKKITKDTLKYFMDKCGTGMDGMEQEIEKLVCYDMDSDIVTKDDIDAVCTTQVSSQIFQMIDAIASKRQQQAMDLYYDLLTLREKPLSILFLITRHFNILLQIKELSGQNKSEIAKKAGVPPFAVGKYVSQAGNFTRQGLLNGLRVCVDMEEKVKTGRMEEQMAVELLIIQFSQKNM